MLQLQLCFVTAQPQSQAAVVARRDVVGAEMHVARRAAVQCY